MQKLIILLILILVSTEIFGQNPEVIEKTVVYKNVAGQELHAHVFYTEASQEKTGNTALALFHGGGWVFGDPSEFFEACRWFARKGYVAVSFQYRLSRNEDGSFPHPDITPVESVKDARSALRWLRENANDYHIDPEKIVAGGQSAGGQLALSTALTDSVNESTDDLNVSPEPNALLLYSSNVNTLEPWIDNLLGDDSREKIWDISPYHNLKKNMPPAIAFHGEEDDQVLPYIVRMFQTKTLKMGNVYELHTYPGFKHYLAEGNDKYARYFDEEILELSNGFLEKFGF